MLLVMAIVAEHTWQDAATVQLLLIYLVPYVVAGWSTVGEAVVRMGRGDIFNEHSLMTIATIGALAIGFMPGGSNEFAEAVFVMLFYLVGETFEEYAEDKSRRSISHLLELRPSTACVMRSGRLHEVSPETVTIGETIAVRPGDKIPLDGEITEGGSSLDTSALTGESMPRDVGVGDAVYSGCINLSGVLMIRVTKAYDDSTVERIIDLVENAAASKSRSEAFITRFARTYTPTVVILALLVAIVPPLFYGSYMPAFTMWLGRALMFLVVACPCALVISVPLTFFAGIGGASKHGILIKGSNHLETLAEVKAILFDKTGTLTEGRFGVRSVHPVNMDASRLLLIAAIAERYSAHPVAAALRSACDRNIVDDAQVSDTEEIAGQGVSAVIMLGGAKHTVHVGNTRLMETAGTQWQAVNEAGTIVHVALDGSYAGSIVIADSIKSDARDVIATLKGMGIKQTVMLTGDNDDVAREVAAAIGIDEYEASLMPNDKMMAARKQIAHAHQSAGKVAFVGDGINDAPTLALADVGIAMGAMGSGAAIEASDVVLMDDRLSKIATAITTARHTVSIAKQNTAFAIGVKIAVLVLATVGLATMWMAVMADVGVTVIAVLNAMRALKA